MTLLEEARRLSSEFAETAAEGDELRRLSDRSWKALVEGGFVRGLQPARWGGGEVHYRDFFDAVAEIAKVSPAAGWVAGVVGVHPWQLALFDNQAQVDMWGDDPTRMHSSSYNPTGKAQKVDGGYKVWGRWSFSSGCDHCGAVNLAAVVGRADLGDGRTMPELRSFVLFRDQYEIDDNWHVAGLKGTGSKDIVVPETFVPDYRSQSHVDYALGLRTPGQELNSGVLYRLPWSVVFHMAIVAAMLGSAQGFVETWIDENSRRMLPGGVRLADDALIQRKLADATWTLNATLAKARANIDEMWEMAEAGETASMEDRARWRWDMNRGCEQIGAGVLDLFHAASGRSLYLDHPLQHRFQDVEAALSHAFFQTDPLAKAVGGNLLGATTPAVIL